ncbi:FAD:protein FMN transferase [Fodinibius sediminis]|uniref:FAD:protein FMN transferase n=1 Tax=Fodinibius sediminis TaxID=1214077 RepID=A0A521C4V3_9BACT|nr:FAD:protein FMN transferase [Fodinibius sediminis]SMO54444.1 thiamine biosynthesis lipoprotein [Fodinibius sediminis]
MAINRKQFLEIAVTGGMGAFLGGAALLPGRWREKGVSLTSVHRRSLVMGSIISFQVIAESEEEGYEAIRRAEQAFRTLEKTFSMYDSDSEMARLTRQAGREAMTVTEESRRLLHFAKEVHQASEGRFDITIEPAMRRWGFRETPSEPVKRPGDRELRKIERLIGSEKIELEGGRVMLAEAGMAIDTGGIAGGYALDKALEVMKQTDVAAGFINFSGDIHCFGKPLDQQKWTVHLLNPETKEPVREPVELVNEALSTSGAYQNRRYDESDHSWGHLLLPDRAKPAEPVGSVTAVHASAMVADAWSTAAYLGAAAPEEVRTIVLTDRG